MEPFSFGHTEARRLKVSPGPGRVAGRQAARALSKLAEFT